MAQSPEAEAIIRQFQSMRSDCAALAQKIGEMEMEKNEHNLVIGAIKDMEPGRKCFRMIGGVLIERTVGEVLPAVEKNREGIEAVIKQLGEQLTKKEQELIAFQTKYKIRIQGQAEQQGKAQASERKEGGSGVLV
eukprot:tig00020780_g13811.t1